jgi:hypothetical protein
MQTSFEEKQTALKKAEIPIHLDIRENILLIRSMRNSGETAEDNKKIEELMTRILKIVNSVIKEIQNYVAAFNQKSERKLSFNVKRASLPK